MPSVTRVRKASIQPASVEQSLAVEPAPALAETPASVPTVLAPAPARLFVGTSGWDYPTWKPGFYPADVPRKRFLAFYTSQLNSCEVNYSFRKLPTPEDVQAWLAQTPPDFRFSFKAPQRITHFSRLRDCEGHVQAFFDVLKPVSDAGRLGLVLFQLPPNFKADHARLREFLMLAPLREASAPLVAFEFRHASWFGPETGGVLREGGGAFCIAETDDLITPELHPAAEHTSFRLRKGGGYKPAEIQRFVERILPLTKDRDVYVYFKHEDEPTGALNARAFLQAACAGKDAVSGAVGRTYREQETR